MSGKINWSRGSFRIRDNRYGTESIGMSKTQKLPTSKQIAYGASKPLVDFDLICERDTSDGGQHWSGWVWLVKRRREVIGKADRSYDSADEACRAGRVFYERLKTTSVNI
jgi:hypothetical protein